MLDSILSIIKALNIECPYDTTWTFHLLPEEALFFVIGFLKCKSAVLIHRTVLGKKRVSGLHFWVRGYCVSTVGLDEETIRKYIRDQEKSEQEHLELKFDDV